MQHWHQISGDYMGMWIGVRIAQWQKDDGMWDAGSSSG
jgi:hypothetical protein